MVYLKNYKMNASRNVLFVCIFLMISCQNNRSTEHYAEAKNQVLVAQIPATYFGSFTANVETEATTTGMASISYHFSITEVRAKLRTTSFHEPIQCEGRYKGHLENGILNLVYDGTEENCKTEGPNFKIKKADQMFFVQGLGGEATFNEWIELQKE